MSRESLASIWARRAITIPLYFLLFGVIAAAAPLWLAVALAVDLCTARLQLPRTRALCFFALYASCEVAGIVAACFAWGREANAALQRHWTNALFGGATRIFSMRLQATGLELARSGPFLLFVRHTSVADTVLAAAVIANPAHLLLRYVLKRELLWDPCLDIVGRRLPNAFVDRRAPKKQAEVAAIVALTHALDARSAVLIYPEGTRFSEAKRAQAMDRLAGTGNAALVAIAETYRSVLPPRLAGPLALLDAAPTSDVVILEHTGFEGAASFKEFWRGGLIGREIRVRVRRIEAAKIPTVHRDQWLFERWREVDQWISS